MIKLLKEAVRHRENGDRAAFVTLVRIRGSAPQVPGAKMLVVDRPGEHISYGTIGGGALEHAAQREALEILRSGRGPEYFEKDLGRDLSMACGGEAGYLIEPVASPDRLVICGAGHVGRALYGIMRETGFSIILVDGLKEYANPEKFPDAERIVNSWEEKELEAAVPVDERTYIVIVSRDHATDFRLARHFLPGPWAYLGVIASSGKAAILKKELEREGYPPERIAKITSPIGLPLGGPNPAEIAVSIAAQIIELRYTATS